MPSSPRHRCRSAQTEVPVQRRRTRSTTAPNRARSNSEAVIGVTACRSARRRARLYSLLGVVSDGTAPGSRPDTHVAQGTEARRVDVLDDLHENGGIEGRRSAGPRMSGLPWNKLDAGGTAAPLIPV